MKLFAIIFGRKKKEKSKTETKSSAEVKIAPESVDEIESEVKATGVTKTATAQKLSSAPKTTSSKKTAMQKKAPKAASAQKTRSKSDTKSKKSPAPETIEKEETVHSSKHVRSGKFEIKKSRDGRFVFNLYASNGVIVATSQVYSSSTSAMNGIRSVIANASAPVEDQTLKNATPIGYPKWEIYLDKGNQYRFRLSASNGSCVCHSQGYTSKANCKKGIDSIIKFASDAEITKTYLDKK